MTDIQITRISKPGCDDRHEQVTHLGDSDRMYTRWDVICWIEDGETFFHTMIGGRRADIRVREVAGFKYLQAAIDGSWNDDLLALPSEARTERARHPASDDRASPMLSFSIAA
jgi:hypothetical protein